MGRAVALTELRRGVCLTTLVRVILFTGLLSGCRHDPHIVDEEPYRILPGRLHFDLDPEEDESSEYNQLGYSPSYAALTPAPIRIQDRPEIVHWDLPLQEVVLHALSNSKVIRQGGQFLSLNNALLRSPESVATVYDQRIQSTGVLFGQRGVQAALSEFDTQFTTRLLWGNSSTTQNNANMGIATGSNLVEDSMQFQSSLQRSLYSGGQVSLSHNWNYTSNNIPRLFPSAYDGNLKAEFRQPLLAGAGSQYTRTAGPVSDNIQGVTGVQQGILISRINNTLAQADFELSVIAYMKELEAQYWKLHQAYQTHEIEQSSLDDARRILDIVQARANAPGGDLARVVEAREGVLQSEKRVLTALDAIYSNESQLRLLMGITLDPETLIHPIDAPIVAEMQHDWFHSLDSALSRRPELRRQKAAIRSAELQLLASENLNRPRLDLVASGQTNGFGDALLGPRNRPSAARPLGSAYDRLFRFQETGWNAGVEYSQPLGLRITNEQVKNSELKLAKSMTLLQAQEAQIVHELTAAFQAADFTYVAMKHQSQVLDNATDRLAAAEADYNSNKDGRGFLELDSLNRAREILSAAAVELGQAQVAYSMAITDIEYHCGRLLDRYQVTLGDAPEAAMNVAQIGVAMTEPSPPSAPVRLDEEESP